MVDFEFDIGHLENGVWFSGEFGQEHRIDIKFSVTNNTDRKIKRTEISFFPMNTDKKLSTYDFLDNEEKTFEIERPIYPNQTYASYFENVWFDKSIVKVYALYAHITFERYDYLKCRILKQFYIK